MHAEEKFAVRIIVSEYCVGDDLVRAFQGWSQVTSFGRTQFGKRVSVGDALSVLTIVDLLEVEYDLSVPRCGAVSPVAICSTPVPDLKEPAIRDYAPSPIVRKTPDPHSRRDTSLSRKMLRLGWAAVVFGLFLATGFMVTGIAENRETVPGQIDSIGVCIDHFQDNRYGWTINHTAAIESGKYQITNLNSDKAVLVANGRLSGRDFVAEATVTFIEGEKESFAGLAFHIRNDENFYFFGTAPDGSFAVVKRELGFWRRLFPDGGVKHFQAKDWRRAERRLKIVVEGIYMEFYLDGELLTTVRDESFEEGSFGFYVDKNLNAAFDNLAVELDWYELVKSLAMR
ncbi:hypothetical protein E3J62_01455 [candidate division TA06 bacterium]|uniref:3-keto-disaccharide hydrolase domain-containing protein n=1 Tax=candidate division TA06 bacterium TaxID=2250710 RepID=A0A523UY56_UNCT6|nr:MAG: hypothetical protein E3J62_01455 [candidate division TA06 bacterium]